MNLTFRGIGFTPDDEDREFLDKKLKSSQKGKQGNRLPSRCHPALCLEEGEGGIAGCL